MSMPSPQPVPFGDLPWEIEAEGVRARVADVDGARWAIVEYAPGAGRPEWCDVGHRGYVVSGEITYDLVSGGAIVASAGQGFLLPREDAHRGINHGDVPALLLVIDDRV
jgi:quercetin dioxygenase-like cupin family protein